METLPLDAPTIPTVRDLIRRLGDIPSERILLDPPPGRATEEDLIELLDGEPKRICELVDSTLVEKPMGMAESIIASRVSAALCNFADEEELGEPCGEDGPIRMVARNVRLPDVSFFLYDNLPDGEIPNDPICPFVPDIAVEVISQGNTVAEIKRKRSELFASGLTLFWEIDPRRKTVSTFTSPTAKTVLGEDDVITGGTVLPGFELSVRRLFRKPAKGRKKS